MDDDDDLDPPPTLLLPRRTLPLLIPSFLLPLSSMAKTTTLCSARLISATNRRRRPAAHARLDIVGIVVASACFDFATERRIGSAGGSGMSAGEEEGRQVPWCGVGGGDEGKGEEGGLQVPCWRSEIFRCWTCLLYTTQIHKWVLYLSFIVGVSLIDIPSV
jgi:hypothetical protein